MGYIEKFRNDSGIVLTNSFGYVEGGESAEIYSPGSKFAVKIPKRKSVKKYRSLEKDFEFQKEIFEAGYPVPEPYGITKAISDGSFRHPHLSLEKCLGMELIKGADLNRGRYLGFRLDIDNMKEEAEKIVESIEKNLRLAPSKNYGLWNHNIMWDEKNKRVVLIDFENWERV